MRHATSPVGWLFRQSPCLLIAAIWSLPLGLLFSPFKHSGSALASSESVTTETAPYPSSSQGPSEANTLTESDSLSESDTLSEPDTVPEPDIAPDPDTVPEPDMTQPSIQLDPLNSPYPIPWNWVLATQDEGSGGVTPKLRYYRTQALISPDGQFAAYSRIQMRVMPDFTHSRVNSVLFIENLRTGDLQTVTAASPFADNPFMANSEPQRAGMVAILIPVAWSASGDRVLAREFESLFGTDIASDFAVVWERQTNRIRTIAPNGVQYSNAILLGWSQTNPDRVLFRAGQIGDEIWGLWAVDFSGQTVAAIEDQPVTFGQTVTNVWAGPQAHR